MGIASVVAAIGFGAVAFMIRFLIALLRDGVPSVCYWVVPVRKPEKGKDQQALSRIHAKESWRAIEAECGAPYQEPLENENHAKEKYSQGLIALNIRNVPDRFRRRAISARHSVRIGEHHPWFE